MSELAPCSTPGCKSRTSRGACYPCEVAQLRELLSAWCDTCPVCGWDAQDDDQPDDDEIDCEVCAEVRAALKGDDDG